MCLPCFKGLKEVPNIVNKIAKSCKKCGDHTVPNADGSACIKPSCKPN